MALDDYDDHDYEEAAPKDLWVGPFSAYSVEMMFRRDWETVTPAGLWDGRHEHTESTHNQARYPDPEHCEFCWDGANQVIRINRDRLLRAAAHAARNARLAEAESRNHDTSRDERDPDPGRRFTRQLTSDLRMAFAEDAADHPGEVGFVPGEDTAERIAWWLVKQGWRRPL